MNILDLLALVLVAFIGGMVLDFNRKRLQDGKEEVLSKLKEVDKKNDSLSATDLATSANEFLNNFRNKRPRR